VTYFVHDDLDRVETVLCWGAGVALKRGRQRVLLNRTQLTCTVWVESVNTHDDGREVGDI
jgi:hypothetical protein